MDKSQAFILWFDQLRNEDVPLVGGKNASLGEMYSELAAQGVFKPVIDRVMPMSEVADAHRLIAERAQFGKIILRP